MADSRTGGAAPTVLRVVLGKRLQHLRERAGVTFEQAARSLDVTHATIRRMEKAEVGLKVPYVEKLLRTYGVSDPEEIDGFVSLAREANQPGWWHRYRDVLPEWFSVFVSLESESEVIRAYEPHYVPGLLQTESYARAVPASGYAARTGGGDQTGRRAAHGTADRAHPGDEPAAAVGRHRRDGPAAPARLARCDARADRPPHPGHRAAERGAADHAVQRGAASGHVRPLSPLPVPSRRAARHGLLRESRGRGLLRPARRRQRVPRGAGPDERPGRAAGADPGRS